MPPPLRTPKLSMFTIGLVAINLWICLGIPHTQLALCIWIITFWIKHLNCKSTCLGGPNGLLGNFCMGHKCFYLKNGCKWVQWANMITLEKDCMFVFPIFFFSFEWILEQFLLQFVVINSYSCPNRWHFKIIFE